MKKIIFPEGNDQRILEAVELLSKKICKCIIIGNKEEIFGKIKVNENIEIVDSKKLGEKDRNLFGVEMVKNNEADAMISGADSTTAEVLKPAFKLLKKKNVKSSGVFYMKKGNKEFLIADCAVNTEMNSEILADIIIETNETAKILGMIPRIAVLSYSTKGTAKGKSVDEVKNAVKISIERNPELIIEGEIQADVAVSKIIAEKKCPTCKVKGDANILIMPDLNCGNICHKLLEHLGGYKCVGPIIQGLQKPINDLSRGCKTEQIVELAKITLKQINIDKN